MAEYQWIKMIAFLVYSVALWIFFRFWYQDVFSEELKEKYEEAMKENKWLCEKNEQLETEIKAVKNSNETLIEALHTVREAIQTILKTQGTELYNQLTDRISGAKERLEEALNTGYDVGNDDWNNSDIAKYIRV